MTFSDHLTAACQTGALVSLVLSKPCRGCGDLPPRVDVRPIKVREAIRYQWSTQKGKQVTHENLDAAATIDRVREWIGSRYRDAHLRTSTSEVTVRCNRRGEPKVTVRQVAGTALSLDHNREKQYIISPGQPCLFLEEIGVMSADGKVKRQQEHKFRQINRYLEIVADLLPSLPAEGPLNIIDFGCGKSGLTYALYHFLHEINGRTLNIIGLDRNESVITGCQRAVERFGWEGIRFEAGDISTFRPQATDLPVHLAVSLHACDTATDAALKQAVDWQAEVILAVPCCQHELSTRLASPPLESLLRHGILKERFAALASDALRAEWLEQNGYRTQVLEFIDMEHTPKNLLIRAVNRQEDTSAARSSSRSDSIKSILGIESSFLESLAKDESK